MLWVSWLGHILVWHIDRDLCITTLYFCSLQMILATQRPSWTILQNFELNKFLALRYFFLEEHFLVLHHQNQLHILGIYSLHSIQFMSNIGRGRRRKWWISTLIWQTGKKYSSLSVYRGSCLLMFQIINPLALVCTPD